MHAGNIRVQMLKVAQIMNDRSRVTELCTVFQVVKIWHNIEEKLKTVREQEWNTEKQ